MAHVNSPFLQFQRQRSTRHRFILRIHTGKKPVYLIRQLARTLAAHWLGCCASRFAKALRPFHRAGNAYSKCRGYFTARLPRYHRSCDPFTKIQRIG